MAIPLAGGLARARYRVHQFTRGLRPHLAPGEIAEAREVLSEAEFRLFMGAQARDRRHSVDLYRLLLSAGASRPMLVAALVHDVGKGDIATWHRVAFVILGPLNGVLAAPSGPRWRRALWRLRHHARLGAEMLRRAGSSARVVEIVERHTDARVEDAEIEAFIRADDSV
ncbi:MAG: HDIG domain-containing protein [Dehalococcoidia bacterium]|nr:HDIG domain-containing protein [Dehalococcoidia bacterium]